MYIGIAAIIVAIAIAITIFVVIKKKKSQKQKVSYFYFVILLLYKDFVYTFEMQQKNVKSFESIDRTITISTVFMWFKWICLSL